MTAKEIPLHQSRGLQKLPPKLVDKYKRLAMKTNYLKSKGFKNHFAKLLHENLLDQKLDIMRRNSSNSAPKEGEKPKSSSPTPELKMNNIVIDSPRDIPLNAENYEKEHYEMSFP